MRGYIKVLVMTMVTAFGVSWFVGDVVKSVKYMRNLERRVQALEDRVKP